MLHSMTIRLIYLHQLEILYLCCWVKCQSGVIWGHWGQKVIFIKRHQVLQNTQHWYVLMHMHKVDPLYKSYGPKDSSRIIWGHRGQKVIFTKKASSLSEYVALTRDLRTCISLTPSTKVMVLKLIWGHLGSQGQKVIFTKKYYNSFVLHSMTLRLICLHQLETLYLCCGIKY